MKHVEAMRAREVETIEGEELVNANALPSSLLHWGIRRLIMLPDKPELERRDQSLEGFPSV